MLGPTTTPPLIIGLAGRAGSGKSTAGNYLGEALPITQVSFAEPIKRGLLAMLGSTGLTEEQCFGPSACRDTPLWGVGSDVTVRYALQTLGTEWARRYLGEDIWVRVAMSRCLMAPTPYAVVTDCRYENEMRAIVDAGGEVWHIQRPETKPGTYWQRLKVAGSAHASEGLTGIALASLHILAPTLEVLRARVLTEVARLAQARDGWWCAHCGRWAFGREATHLHYNELTK